MLSSCPKARLKDGERKVKVTRGGGSGGVVREGGPVFKAESKRVPSLFCRVA